MTVQIPRVGADRTTVGSLGCAASQQWEIRSHHTQDMLWQGSWGPTDGTGVGVRTDEVLEGPLGLWPLPGPGSVPWGWWSDSLQARQDAAGLSVPCRPQKPATQGWAKLLPTQSASPREPPPAVSPKGNEKSTTKLWVRGNPQGCAVAGREYGKPAPP